MQQPDVKPLNTSGLNCWQLLAAFSLFVLLTLWTWQKWDRAWVEPGESFFPPEWSNEELKHLAWEYPIYRSNDSYQWVHLADELARGNSLPLHYRFDEGPPEGRPNRWHSGLAHLLSVSGSLVAGVQDWPVKRGIHHSAHWLGSVIQLGTLLGGSLLISRLAGRRAALFFAALFYFNAAIAWDFAFSRLDHEAVFQCFFLFHLIGLAGLLQSEAKRPILWAMLAGVSAGACWWISATVMAALSICITLGLLAECARRGRTEKNPSALTRGIITWGAVAAFSILLFSILDDRLRPVPSIATLHPIFILAQIGTALACLALLLKDKKWPVFTLGILCGLTPLGWLAVYQTQAHPWLNPMMRRLHDHIVEFQSPFVNGLWSQAETFQALAIAALALLALFWRKPWHNSLLLSLTIGLILLALLQTRWLGLLGTVGALGLCLQLRHTRSHAIAYLGLALLLLCMATWIHKWNTIEKKPGRIFMTDLALQIGARDINLNLQRLSGGGTIHVAMPYAFAATSALFPEVHPIGTFYWENAEGIEASARFFAGKATTTPIDFAVVQGGLQGAPFAKMINWIAQADITPGTIESSPVWQLSVQTNPKGWTEVPFYGTFPSQQFSVRIFEKTGP